VRIDLNSDVGESYGAWTMGQDEELMPLITSANIACAAHAGDPLVMARTVALAVAHALGIGAHPGYPDRDGFGRRELDMTDAELEASLLYQLGALGAFVRAAGTTMTHVKPHGALYNRAATDERLATAICRAVRAFDPSLLVVGLAGSKMLDVARAAGLATAAEAFADRAYEVDGSLRSRRLPDAILATPEAAAAQAVSIATQGFAMSHDGKRVAMRADTLCIHGDTPGAASYARAVRLALEAAGVTVSRLDREG
jgi:5-oxoprolinase (ATP-hydrolysing) subunit A